MLHPTHEREVDKLARKFPSLVLSLAAFFLIFPPAFAPLASGQVGQLPTITAQPLPGLMAGQQATTLSPDVCQKLPIGQRTACEEELRKSGGRLTPEALQAIMARPEYRGLTPEEVSRGMRLLEQRERVDDKKGPDKVPSMDFEKRRLVIEGPREKTLFDRARQFGKYQDISTDLKPFGYEFFSEAAVQVVTDRKDIPVPLKYVIGAGDEIKLLLWGRVNGQYNLTVDRDGKITIPQIGPLVVAGLTY